MKKLIFLVILTVLSVLLVGCTQKSQYIAITGYAQGGTYTVKLNLIGKDGKRIPTKPEVIKEKIDSLLDVIDFTLSGYNKGSKLSRFNAGETITPNDMFKDIYAFSHKMFLETDGALDVAAGELFNIWGFGFTNDSLPSMDYVKEVMSKCGMGRLKPTMETHNDGTISPSDILIVNDGFLPSLNFNAVAQGYSCDVISDYLHSIGVKDMLVDIGEIRVEGVNPYGQPWTIAVDRPFDGNENPGEDVDGIWQSDGSDQGIVTSGNYRKFYIRDGHKYAHTIDPRNGMPVEHSLLSATIVAKTGALADALATYCMVIGLDDAKDFISSDPDLEGYLIYDENGVMKEWASDGFRLVNNN